MNMEGLNFIPYDNFETTQWDKKVIEFDGDINYTSWMIQYNLIYNKHFLAKNFSGVIINKDNEIIALLLLFLENIEGQFQFSIGQNMIQAPLLNKKLKQKEKISLFDFINTYIDNLAKDNSCNLARFQITPFNQYDINYYSLFGYTETICYPDWYIFKCPFIYLLNLKEELTYLRSNIRKSFKSLINKTEKNSNLIILDKNNPDKKVFDKYVQTHYELKGKTRSIEAFEEDYKAICDGLETVLICEQQDIFVGIIVLYTYNKKAIYNSAMQRYDIENLYPNHYLMWSAIEYLHKEDKYDTFLIGEQIVENNLYSISKKEKNLSFFKQAWGGNLYPWFKAQKVYR